MTNSRGPSASVHIITAAWRAAGMPAPIAADTSLGSTCCVRDCGAISSFELPIAMGQRSICQRHLEAIQAQATQR